METLAMEPQARYERAAAPADATIHGRIQVVRGQKVMLDRDLAEPYGVKVKQLKQAVRRNMERFPEDFMFELSSEEIENLRSQFGTSSWGGARYVPMAFTEQGVAMLSSVLNSEQAILVNIHIIRVFSRMHEALHAHRDVLQKLEQLEERVGTYDAEIQALFNHLTALVSPSEQPRRSIGFKPDDA